MKSLPLVKNWKLTTSNQQERYYNVPGKLDKNLENGFIISNTLPTNLNSHINSFALYCVFQNITIRMNDKIVYQTNDSYLSMRNYDKTPSAYWIIFPLPEDYAGKTVSIEVTSPFQDYSSSIGSILIGTRSSIIFYLIKSELSHLILSLIFIFFGLLFVAIYIFIYHKTDVSKSFCYISFFILWTGFWFLAESGLFQIFTSNYVFINSLSFISLMMMILSILKYYISLECRAFHKLQKLLLTAFYLYVVCSCSLQLFHILDFYETISLFHILIIIIIITLYISIITEVIFLKNHSLLYMLHCITILLISSGLELYYFYFKDHTNTGNFLLIGILLCIVFLAMKEIKKAIKIIEIYQEAKYYKKLATIDFMTDCKNRTAYGEFLNQKQKNFSSVNFFAAIMCDMNGLKVINDKYGHEMGDRAIIKCGSILKENLSDIGQTYRIGGDEFIAILENPLKEEEIEKFLDQINYDFLSADHQFDFKFSVASGYAIYRPEIDDSLDAVLRRADENMYYNKKRLKETLHNI